MQTHPFRHHTFGIRRAYAMHVTCEMCVVCAHRHHSHTLCHMLTKLQWVRDDAFIVVAPCWSKWQQSPCHYYPNELRTHTLTYSSFNQHIAAKVKTKRKTVCVCVREIERERKKDICTDDSAMENKLRLLCVRVRTNGILSAALGMVSERKCMRTKCCHRKPTESTYMVYVGKALHIITIRPGKMHTNTHTKNGMHGNVAATTVCTDISDERKYVHD